MATPPTFLTSRWSRELSWIACGHHIPFASFPRAVHSTRLRLREQSLRIEVSRHFDPETIDECPVVTPRPRCLECFDHAPGLRLLGFARRKGRTHGRGMIRP